jgi:hypothetical protein
MPASLSAVVLWVSKTISMAIARFPPSRCTRLRLGHTLYQKSLILDTRAHVVADNTEPTGRGPPLERTRVGAASLLHSTTLGVPLASTSVVVDRRFLARGRKTAFEA